MSTIFVILLGIFLCIIIYRIYTKIKVRKYSKIYFGVIDAYENMLLARRTFYSARIEGDEETKQMAAELYECSVELLDDPAIRETVVNVLPDELRDECLEKIDEPRYGLF